MPYYLTEHYEPETPVETIKSRWIGLAQERRAKWVRTWFNLNMGKRFCWWDAPDEEALKQVFRDHDVPWKRITEVRLTTPSDWRRRED